MNAGIAAGALVVAACQAACQGEVGTISLGLTTAPGSTLIDGVDRIRVRLTDPPQVVEAARVDGRFQLALEVEATGGPGQLVVEGLDASGRVIATGASPPFAVASLNARIVVYLAPPMSIEPAPVSLPGARSQVAAVALPYGAILAGGRDPGGTVVSDLAVYNAYDHTLTAGLALPAPRAALSIAAGTGSGIYLFGGQDGAGASAGTAWRFDTAALPNGTYAQIADAPALARHAQTMVPIGADRFLVAGAPPLELTAQGVSIVGDVPELGPAGATTRNGAAVFAGAAGIAIARDDSIRVVDASPRPGASVIALPHGDAVVIDETTATRVAADTGTPVAIPNVAAGCAAPSTVSTLRHVVVVCPAQTRIYDATSSAPLASIATGGVALAALTNDQVLLLVNGQLALFTPPSPE